MAVSDFVFFIIAAFVYVATFSVITIITINEYCYDYERNYDEFILHYVGFVFLIFFLISLIGTLLLVFVGMFCDIDAISFSYLPKFLKSDVFLLICLIGALSIVISLIICFKKYSVLDILCYKRIKHKYNGVYEALKISKSSLTKIMDEIDELAEDTPSEIINKLNFNKNQLEKITNQYTVKLKHLELIKNKLTLKMEEKNCKYL